MNFRLLLSIAINLADCWITPMQQSDGIFKLEVCDGRPWSGGGPVVAYGT
jgi:hypothetical protein